jgi:hypothetical protein
MMSKLPEDTQLTDGLLSSEPGDAATEFDAGICADGPDSRGFVKFNLDGEGRYRNCWYTFLGLERHEI